jgi:membrane-associated phospholipid phosphatase
MVSNTTPPGQQSSDRLQNSLRRSLIAGAIALACLGGLAFSVDLDVARWCKAGHIPKELMRFFNFSEVCGHGIGVATILLAAAVLDPTLGGRRAFPRFAGFGNLPFSSDFLRMVGASFAGGIMANVIKATPLDRVRPRAADLSGVTTAFSTFGESIATAIASHSDINSFPSGHAATAAGLAAALSWKYPHGSWLFFLLAASAATQRVVTSAHYPSDVFMGAAVGLACAAAILGRNGPRAFRSEASYRGFSRER